MSRLESELRGDPGAEVDGVADHALVGGLQRLHERFAAVGAAVVDGDGAAVEGLAGVSW